MANNDKKALELELKSKIKYLSDRVKKDEDKLKENFVYWFSWVIEELYMNKYKIEKYESVLARIEIIKGAESVESTEQALEEEISELTQFTSKAYNVRSKSTSEVSNTKSTWDFMVSLELLEEFKRLNKSLR